jgi:hypothetical protein
VVETPTNLYLWRIELSQTFPNAESALQTLDPTTAKTVLDEYYDTVMKVRTT